MLIDRSGLAAHRAWIGVTTLAAVAAGACYWVAASRSPSRPGGSSTLGLVYGTLAGLIVLFELALWLRKRWRHRRLGKAATWMRAHIWLGLLVVPLAGLHSGLRLGGTLSTLLAILLATVVGSGIYGLWRQQRIPRRMILLLPGETMHTAIAGICLRRALEAQEFVTGITGQGEPAAVAALVGAGTTVGARRASARTMPLAPTVPLAGAVRLREAFDRHIRAYLLEGARSGSPLRRADRCRELFAELAGALPEALAEGLRALEAACAERRELDLQLALHGQLHRWLAFHLALSALLLVVLLAHVVYALQYM